MTRNNNAINKAVSSTLNSIPIEVHCIVVKKDDTGQE
jgi:hypothetical protein